VKIFSRDFFHVFLVLSLVATAFSGACTTRKIYIDPTVETGHERFSSAININTADAIALERLPNVGPRLATKILEHRKRHGPFRRIESLMLVEGISDRRFREIRHLIVVE
jgi:competence ComEA-like helix-hairpin-helix protein